MHSAVWYDDVDLLEFLLDRGADATVLDAHGWTALDYARHKCNDLMVEILEQRAAAA